MKRAAAGPACAAAGVIAWQDRRVHLQWQGRHQGVLRASRPDAARGIRRRRRRRAGLSRTTARRPMAISSGRSPTGTWSSPGSATEAVARRAVCMTPLQRTAGRSRDCGDDGALRQRGGTDEPRAGMPDYRFAIIDHPVSSASDDALRAMAAATIAQAHGLLRLT